MENVVPSPLRKPRTNCLDGLFREERRIDIHNGAMPDAKSLIQKGLISSLNLLHEAQANLRLRTKFLLSVVLIIAARSEERRVGEVCR